MSQGRQAVRWNRVLTYGGAIIAFLIGSGFATGQEILQYFTSYGYWGVFGTGLAESVKAGETDSVRRSV